MSEGVREIVGRMFRDVGLGYLGGGRGRLGLG